MFGAQAEHASREVEVVVDGLAIVEDITGFLLAVWMS